MTHQQDEKLRRIKRVKEQVSHEEEPVLSTMLEIMEDMYRSQLNHEVDMQPIADFYRTANNAKKILVWVAGLLAAIGGIFAVIKGLGREILQFLRF